MIFHVVAPDDWLAFPDRPYAPTSLSEEGFVHCSPDEPVTLVVASAFYRDIPVRSWCCSSTNTSSTSRSVGRPPPRGRLAA
jgi:hypothetical protein